MDIRCPECGNKDGFHSNICSEGTAETIEQEYAEGLDEDKWLALSDEHRCECEDCGWRGDTDNLDVPNRLFERLTEGDTMFAGDCPECGATCWSAWQTNQSQKEHDQRKAATLMLAALQHLAAQIDLSKLNVRKDFSLLNAHAGALKAAAAAQAAGITTAKEE